MRRLIALIPALVVACTAPEVAPPEEHSCAAGLAWNGTTCVNVGECAANLDDCDANATCTDVVGGFTCACNMGWEGDGRSCADVDECAKGTAGCGEHATCANAPGGFQCTCDEGFARDGDACVKVDRCGTGALTCGANERCEADACVCARGFERAGATCADARHRVRWAIPDSATSHCTDGAVVTIRPPPGDPLDGQDCTRTTTAPRYEHTADVVRDLVTGLEWQRTTTDAVYTWQAADAACEALVLGGHSDWKLPSEVELHSLLDLGNGYPSIAPQAFDDGIEAFHWSSTPVLQAHEGVPAGAHWYVSFRYGHSGYINTGDKHIRCVRPAPGSVAPARRFTCAGEECRADRAAETVRDHVTGLEWTRAEAPVALTWKEALRHCEALELGGKGDWRLPSMKELFSVMDYERADGFDPAAFPTPNATFTWSSSPAQWEPARAWGVYFNDGGANNTAPTTQTYPVRCVR